MSIKICSILWAQNGSLGLASAFRYPIIQIIES